jgi:hypothetical protein
MQPRSAVARHPGLPSGKSKAWSLPPVQAIELMEKVTGQITDLINEHDIREIE